MSRAVPDTAARRRKYAPVFAALGNGTRLSLVAKLSEGHPKSIAELTKGLRVTRQAVTKHLQVLEDAEIVRSVRSGRESLFELDPQPIREVLEYADDMSARWDRALARLKSHVED